MTESTVVITGVDGGVFIKYNTGALSTGMIKGEDCGFFSTILICGFISRGDFRSV